MNKIEDDEELKDDKEWDPEEALIEEVAALDMDELFKDFPKEPFNIKIPAIYVFHKAKRRRAIPKPNIWQAIPEDD
jgi:hypothetical protein